MAKEAPLRVPRAAGCTILKAASARWGTGDRESPIGAQRETCGGRGRSAPSAIHLLSNHRWPVSKRSSLGFNRSSGRIFDTGHLWFAKQMIAEGLIDSPPLFQLCMGIPYGAPPDPSCCRPMVHLLPGDAHGPPFAIAATSCPGWPSRVARRPRPGRAGDNLYLERGVKATNGQLVGARGEHRENLGAKVATPDAAPPGCSV